MLPAPEFGGSVTDPETMDFLGSSAGWNPEIGMAVQVAKKIYKNTWLMMIIVGIIPVVPHKAVAEVSE